MDYANGPWGYYQPPGAYGNWMDPDEIDEPQERGRPYRPPTAPRGDIGRSADGRCAAIPNLPRSTITTVKDLDTQVAIGVWQVARLDRRPQGVTITAYLPMITVVEKASGRCTNRPGGQTQTFQGAGLRDALNQAANAWCQTV